MLSPGKIVFVLALANIAYNIAYPPTQPENSSKPERSGHKVYEEPVQANNGLDL